MGGGPAAARDALPSAQRLNAGDAAFSLMENYLERAEVIAFLADLGAALDGFVRGMEQFAASRQGTLREHALLAVEHGIAIHRASLEWVRSATVALGETPSALDGG